MLTYKFEIIIVQKSLLLISKENMHDMALNSVTSSVVSLGGNGMTPNVRHDDYRRRMLATQGNQSSIGFDTLTIIFFLLFFHTVIKYCK